MDFHSHYVSSNDNRYIEHLLEIETVKQYIDRWISPPVWSSANTHGGDEKKRHSLKSISRE
ncbi:MAG: hypothetical protein SOX82_05965 [Eubacteriales bacterium]|nr:hypothetical protein [Eubacteriales bacterium]MDY4213215.1 hypothetical protein [Eubacteriales bacterium]